MSTAAPGVLPQLVAGFTDTVWLHATPAGAQLTAAIRETVAHHNSAANFVVASQSSSPATYQALLSRDIFQSEGQATLRLRTAPGWTSTSSTATDAPAPVTTPVTELHYIIPASIPVYRSALNTILVGMTASAGPAPTGMPVQPMLARPLERPKTAATKKDDAKSTAEVKEEKAEDNDGDDSDNDQYDPTSTYGDDDESIGAARVRKGKVLRKRWPMTSSALPPLTRPDVIVRDGKLLSHALCEISVSPICLFLCW